MAGLFPSTINYFVAGNVTIYRLEPFTASDWRAYQTFGKEGMAFSTNLASDRSTLIVSASQDSRCPSQEHTTGTCPKLGSAQVYKPNSSNLWAEVQWISFYNYTPLR